MGWLGLLKDSATPAPSSGPLGAGHISLTKGNMRVSRRHKRRRGAGGAACRANAGQQSPTHGCIGNKIDQAEAQALPEPLVIAEDEGPILANRTAERSAKLVSLERRDR